MANDARTASTCDRRSAADVGRRARLDLRFAYRAGRTILARAYAEPPFRVGRCFADPGGGLHMIMASSAPGIFGGDRFETTIHAGAGTRVRLTSQSALQAHPSQSAEPATLRSRYVVDEGAELECFWDPLIPFAAAELDQRIEIAAAAHARVSWSDAFMAGRAARGERWQFASFAHELRLTHGDRLEYLERFRLRGDTAPSGTWTGGDACYFGSLLVCWDDATADAAEAIHTRLRDWPGVRGAADLIEDHLLLVRLMSPDGAAFHRAREWIRAARELHDVTVKR